MATIENFPRGEYKCVVIDPPWPIDVNAVPGTSYCAEDISYRLMPIVDIRALPIPSVLASDAWLFCWTTQKFLPAALDLLSEWALSYRWTMVWHKKAGAPFGGKVEGVMPFNSPLYNNEFVVVGAQGKPKLVSQKQFKTCFAAPTRGHSVKPAEFYNTLNRVTEPPRIDIFSRRLIPGFDVWGDEVPTETMPQMQYALFGE